MSLSTEMCQFSELKVNSRYLLESNLTVTELDTHTGPIYS